MEVKHLIFDFGKVLVDYDFLRVIRSYFNDEAKMEAFCGIVLSDDFMNRCDKEDVPMEQIVQEEKRKYPQYATQFQLFYDRFEDFILGEMPGMYALLLQLKERGYNLYGLTNWSSKVYGVMRKYDIFSLLDGWVISSEEHLIKPDVAIYHRLCEKFNLLPEECLFTDDKQVNIDGAVRAGMQAVLFTDARTYAEYLKQNAIL